MTPDADYTPEKRDVIQSARLFAQKIRIEDDARDALAEARHVEKVNARALSIASLAFGEAQAASERSTENVRLAEQALRAAGIAFDGAALDFADTLRPRPELSDAEAHAILRVS